MNARERIIQSAKELFSKKGYSNTSVDEIVRHAGLSKGAFYFYFKSKDALMEELINQIADRTKEIMRKWIERDISAQEMIKGHIREFFIECYQDRHIAYVFFFELLCSKEEFRKIYHKHTEDFRSLLTKMVKRGYERGEFVYGRVETLVSLIVGYIKLMYVERLLLKDMSLEEILKETEEGLDIILRGLRCGS
ncbi:MAG: TetR/AcrR family transcriptional regulator [Aquificaceae bacterium]